MSDRKKLVLIAGFCLFVFLLAFFLIPQLIPQKRIKAQDVLVYLQDGDIICRLGDRFWSQYFKDISIIDKRFSHLGIVRIHNDKITVIHAEGRAIEGKDFVNEVDLDEFLEIAKTVGVYRLNNYDSRMISSTALDYIGYPFDWSFDLEDESKIYCTELLYVILKKIAPEIQLNKTYFKEIKKDIIPLEAVSNSEYFNEVAFIKIE